MQKKKRVIEEQINALQRVVEETEHEIGDIKKEIDDDNSYIHLVRKELEEDDKESAEVLYIYTVD